MIRELVRYALTGILSVILNTIIIVALTELAGFHYLVSIALCFVIVVCISFCLNRVWTFGKRGGSAGIDLGRYVLVALANIAVSLSLSYVLVEYGGVPYPLATIILSAVFVPVSFLVHRHWSFALRWPTR